MLYRGGKLKKATFYSDGYEASGGPYLGKAVS